MGTAAHPAVTAGCPSTTASSLPRTQWHLACSPVHSRSSRRRWLVLSQAAEPGPAVRWHCTIADFREADPAPSAASRLGSSRPLATAAEADGTSATSVNPRWPIAGDQVTMDAAGPRSHEEAG